MKHEIRKLTAKIISAGTALLAFATPVSANAIMEAPWFQGGMQLAKDATAAGLVIFPLIGIAFSIYYWFRRGIAEPEEKKRWQDRAVNAMLIGIVVGLISGVASLLSSYMVAG